MVYVDAMKNKEIGVQECDATMFNSSTSLCCTIY